MGYLFAAFMMLGLTMAARHSDEELLEMFKDGFRKVERETVDGAVVLEEGHIPTWLAGNFIRHACGDFGETDHMDKSRPNFITHLFDCIEIGSKFRIENGNVTFTNRWYDSAVNSIYNSYGREMNDSSVFFTTAFSTMNNSQVDRWIVNMTDYLKVSFVPHVGWWQLGDDAIAMTELPIGVIIDPEEVVQKGYLLYNDDNFGVPFMAQDYFTNNNPVHEQMEPDGTLWSTTAVLKFETQTQMKTWRIVYKVGLNKVREVVGAFHFEDTDVTKCQMGTPYADYSARYGYLHSFAMTENYIILPESAFMIDTCSFVFYDLHKPFFESFRYEPDGFTRLLVMRKKDGIFVANITIPPMFITHQLGSYEEGDLMHIDMVTFDDASIYTQHVFLENTFTEHSYTTNIKRVTINMSNWTVVSIRNLRDPNKPAAPLEMVNINYKYNMKKYTYAWITKNFIMKDQNAIVKLNVDTGEEIEYVFEEGMYAQEPNFIEKPEPTSEDDGVVLVQGIDGRKHKAFMVVIDARTMQLIGHVTAPDIALFGLHSKLFPFKANTTSNDQPSSSSFVHPSRYIMLIVVLSVYIVTLNL